MNAELTSTYEDIDRLLEATLEIDDYVDLESLNSSAVHPEFDPGPLSQPNREPLMPANPGAPIYTEPEAPKA